MHSSNMEHKKLQRTLAIHALQLVSTESKSTIGIAAINS